MLSKVEKNKSFFFFKKVKIFILLIKLPEHIELSLHRIGIIFLSSKFKQNSEYENYCSIIGKHIEIKEVNIPNQRFDIKSSIKLRMMNDVLENYDIIASYKNMLLLVSLFKINKKFIILYIFISIKFFIRSIKFSLKQSTKFE